MCGKGLVGRSAHRNGHRHKYYSCSSRANHRGCKLPFIRADIVEVLVLEEIQAIFRKPVLLQRIWDLVNKQLQADRPSILTELDKVREDIIKAKFGLERYFGAYESGVINDETIQARVAELNLRVQQLEDEKVILRIN